MMESKEGDTHTQSCVPQCLLVRFSLTTKRKVTFWHHKREVMCQSRKCITSVLIKCRTHIKSYSNFYDDFYSLCNLH